ncbi:MAG TPA: GH25 family lysozyme [Acidimicrobiales bacterium]|nr:GH25 family lysozyme [Acidimicrobiales bacterium]
MTGRRRRWPYAVAAVVLVVVGVAVWAWWVWLPGYRPALRAGERYGVDVSSHQGPIDWQRVAGDGVAFAYVKSSEGGDFVDRRFGANWAGAGGAGLDRGAYHFFTLCAPGEEQARNFLQAAPPDPAALAPAVDVELVGNCRARPDRAVVARELEAFGRVVEEAWGRQVLVYEADEFGRRYPDLLPGRPRWVRSVRRPGGEWSVWQVHGLAHVEGITGDTDLDVMGPEVQDGGG